MQLTRRFQEPVANLQSSLRELERENIFYWIDRTACSGAGAWKSARLGHWVFSCVVFTEAGLFLHTPKSQQNDLRRVRER